MIINDVINDVHTKMETKRTKDLKPNLVTILGYHHTLSITHKNLTNFQKNFRHDFITKERLYFLLMILPMGNITTRKFTQITNLTLVIFSNRNTSNRNIYNKNTQLFHDVNMSLFSIVGNFQTRRQHKIIHATGKTTYNYSRVQLAPYARERTPTFLSPCVREEIIQ